MHKGRLFLLSMFAVGILLGILWLAIAPFVTGHVPDFKLSILSWTLTALGLANVIMLLTHRFKGVTRINKFTFTGINAFFSIISMAYVVSISMGEWQSDPMLGILNSHSFFLSTLSVVICFFSICLWITMVDEEKRTPQRQLQVSPEVKT